MCARNRRDRTRWKTISTRRWCKSAHACSTDAWWQQARGKPSPLLSPARMSSIAPSVGITDHARDEIWSSTMEELNGRIMACQILITGLIARIANNSPDPLRFLTDFRDEIKAVVGQVNIAGADDA